MLRTLIDYKYPLIYTYVLRKSHAISTAVLDLLVS